MLFEGVDADYDCNCYCKKPASSLLFAGNLLIVHFAPLHFGLALGMER